jgi:twitching motility protein PilT
MSLVPSLLQAVIGLDGEALVIHVGEKPYVVAPSGQVELATRALTFEAVTGILEQMLPGESRQALEEFGAVQYELPPFGQLHNEHFTVVAARGGDDVWVEVRRRRVSDDDLVPAEMFETAQALPAHGPAAEESPDSDLGLPDSVQLWPDRPDVAAMHRERPPEMARGKGALGGFDLPDSIEIDPIPPPRETRVEAPKPPKVTLFPIGPKPAPPPPRQVVPEPPHIAGTVRPEFEEFAAPPPPQIVPPPAVPAPPTLEQVLKDAGWDESAIEVVEPAADFEPRAIELDVEPATERQIAARFDAVIDAPDEPVVEAPPPAVRQPITPAAFVPPPVPEPEPEPEPAFEPVPEPVLHTPPPAPEPVVVHTPPPAPEPAVLHAPPPAPEPVVLQAPPPAPEPAAPAPPPRAPEPVAVAPVESDVDSDAEFESPLAAVVLPMSRVAMQPEPGHALTGLDRLLRIAASRGASTLFVASKARPSIRVNGEMQMLDEPALGPDDVEALLVELMPDRNRDALRSGVATEWVYDVAEVGRVSCMSFRDHRGAGAIFRMTPLRAISAEQLGLSREIRALATETEGLVLITGPKGSGKTTLLSAFVDLINRTRRVYVIVIERDIRVVHESRHSLVSQREAKDDHETLEGVRNALREEPDVLVIEDLRAPDLVSLALDSAGSGRLVIATVPAQTAVGAIEHVVSLGPADQRRQVQLALAENLRGIVAQVLVRKPGGGQMAARELLLNSSAVASLIAEGKLTQIGPSMESGRKFGMVPLNDALVACVKSGEVDAREAYRRAADRVGFLALLKRQGIDTTFVERPA